MFQMMILLSGSIAIIIKGVIDHDGFGNILQTYRDGNRINFGDFQADPRYRHTFWSIIIGGVFGSSGQVYCTSQSFIQRMLVCKNQRNVREN